MKKLLLFVLTLLMLGSCKKNNIHPNLNTLVPNAYLPLDDKDQWIYQITNTFYADTFEPDDTALIDSVVTSLDTLSARIPEIIDQYEVAPFLDALFHTNSNTIQLILPPNNSFDTIQVIDFLFTDQKDTSWNYTMENKVGDSATISFSQSLAKDSLDNPILDELNVKYFISPFSFSSIFKYDDITFKKGIGIKLANQFNPFSASELELIKYIDN